jgi:hypothetical protein
MKRRWGTGAALLPVAAKKKKKGRTRGGNGGGGHTMWPTPTRVKGKRRGMEDQTPSEHESPPRRFQLPGRESRRGRNGEGDAAASVVQPRSL